MFFMLLTVIVSTLCTDSQKNVQKSQDHGYTFDQLFTEWFKMFVHRSDTNG